VTHPQPGDPSKNKNKKSGSDLSPGHAFTVTAPEHGPVLIQKGLLGDGPPQQQPRGPPSSPTASSLHQAPSPTSSLHQAQPSAVQAPDLAPEDLSPCKCFVSRLQAYPSQVTPEKVRAGVLKDFPLPVPPISRELLPNPSSFGESPTANLEGNGRRALDLFSGSGSVAKRLRDLGYTVTTLDKNSRCRPEIAQDILRWQYKKAYPPGYFDIVVASPPCEQYSQARTTKARDYKDADACVKRTLQIIEYFQPGTWWVENPKNGHLRNRPFMQKYSYVDIDYCQFSEWGYKKPTRFWGSEQLTLLPSVLCNPKTCPNTKDGPHGRKNHKERLGGYKMKFSTAQKGIVPWRVVDYLLQDGIFHNAPDHPQLHVIHERYQVRPHFVNMILEKFDGLQPSVEAFANENLHLFQRWWGPGSPEPDAFACYWGGRIGVV
jgi:hypothetical protein